MTIHYIYKITNSITGKSYIGKRKTDNKNDNYFGSGIALKAAIKTYGKENFKKEIIEILSDEKSARSREKFWIKELKTLVPDGYNIHEGGYGGNNFIHHPKRKEIIAKISASKKGKKLANKTKILMSEARQGKNQNPCRRVSCLHCRRVIDIRNFARWHNGKCKELSYNFPKPPDKRWAEETNKKRSSTLKGREFSKEHKSRIGAKTRKRWSKAPTLECYVCGFKSKSKGNLNRWHNTNCRFIPPSAKA